MDEKSYYERFLTDRLEIKSAEKAEHGEVFTPLEIVDEMFASLPASVWSDPDLRWLDPACGVGNFLIRAITGGTGYPGLYDGLKKKIRDDGRRLKHIIENMIVMYDINAKNTATVRRLLTKMCPGCKPAVKTADFLKGAAEPFDIIVGNPPYNAGGIKREGTKRLHVNFTERSLELLRPGGYLLFICPPNYREAGSTMNALFRECPGNFRYIHIFGPDETHRMFKIQSRVDIFLYEKGAADSKPCTIVDEFGVRTDFKVDLERHIPNFGFSIFKKLRGRKPAGVEAYRTTEASTVDCVKSGLGSGSHKILHLIVEGGKKVVRRKKAHPLEGVPKVVLNGLGSPYVYYDSTGTYGVSQVPVVVERPAAGLVKLMKSSLFCFMVWALRITGNNNLPYIFDDVPTGYGADIRLTAAERKLLENFEPYRFEDKDIDAGVC
jgi:hypothetical protein